MSARETPETIDPGQFDEMQAPDSDIIMEGIPPVNLDDNANDHDGRTVYQALGEKHILQDAVVSRTS